MGIVRKYAGNRNNKVKITIYKCAVWLQGYAAHFFSTKHFCFSLISAKNGRAFCPRAPPVQSENKPF